MLSRWHRFFFVDGVWCCSLCLVVWLCVWVHSIVVDGCSIMPSLHKLRDANQKSVFFSSSSFWLPNACWWWYGAINSWWISLVGHIKLYATQAARRDWLQTLYILGSHLCWVVVGFTWCTYITPALWSVFFLCCFQLYRLMLCLVS